MMDSNFEFTFWRIVRKASAYNQTNSVDQLLFDRISSSTITNADDSSDGALTASGPHGLTEVLSHQQAVDSAVTSGIIDATVKWDQRNPSQLIRVLEGCGQSQGPTTVEWVKLQHTRSALTWFWWAPAVGVPYSTQAPT
ncbi:hypothetical protein FPQ18DRAFT_310519 [Pyronema domesticum]|nr:hypothetical protein FPQ18DRAFT_310519 [Pyronema domesticum]